MLKWNQIWTLWYFICICIFTLRHTSEDSCGPSQVWFIPGSNFQMPAGAICSKHKYKHQGTSSHHATQEGDLFCIPEMDVFWCKMCASTPNQNILCVSLLLVLLSTVKWEPVTKWKEDSEDEDISPKINIKKPIYSLEIYTEAIFRDMSYGLMKIKLICLATLLLEVKEGI